MPYRIRLLVPSSYTDEARLMIEDHPRAAVIDASDSAVQPGSDLLVVISHEPRILQGLHRWWMDRRRERRADPPLAILQPDDTTATFNDYSADELEEFGRRDEMV